MVELKHNAKFPALVFSLFLSFQLLNHCGFEAAKAELIENNESKAWGYVEVRPKAHMFWLLYKSPDRVEDPNKSWPIILWLHGGPGASGVGIGNFLEIGPKDVTMNPREFTWLKKADLLFVDSPVGTGYSYVEDESLLVETDEEAVMDLTKLLIHVFNNKSIVNSSNPVLHIIGESYGGRLGVKLALLASNAKIAPDLKVKVVGVTLGSTWTSPEDSVLSWGSILKDLSRIYENGLQKTKSMAIQIKQKIDGKEFEEARDLYSTLQKEVISEYTNSVDMTNFLRDAYENHFDPLASQSLQHNLTKLMNDTIKINLKIPANVSWNGIALNVYNSLKGDFMKPRIEEVDDLLSSEVNVTIYVGQVDLLASTKGTEAWVQKLKWEGLETFLSTNRTPIFCDGSNKTRGFSRSYRNFHFYWILEAGHFVPADQPCASFKMVGNIVK